MHQETVPAFYPATYQVTIPAFYPAMYQETVSAFYPTKYQETVPVFYPTTSQQGNGKKGKNTHKITEQESDSGFYLQPTM